MKEYTQEQMETIEQVARARMRAKAADLIRLATDKQIQRDRPPELVITALLQVAGEIAQENGIDLTGKAMQDEYARASGIDPSLVQYPASGE